MKVVNKSGVKDDFIKDFNKCIKDYLMSEGNFDNSTLVITAINTTGIFHHFACTLCVDGKRYYRINASYDEIFNDIIVTDNEFIGSQESFV